MDVKNRVCLWLFCIFILIALSAAIYIRGQDAGCNKCELNFEQYEQAGRKLDKPIEFKLNVTDLYTSISNGECIVSWDRTYGWRKN